MSPLLAGCRSSTDSVDRLNLSTGDAIARNKAVHTIDPWPNHAFKMYQKTNGQRVLGHYDEYRGERPKVAPKKP